MEKKRIWVVSEVFYPDETSTAYIMTSIADHLADEGEIHVLCGPAGYGEIKGKVRSLEKLIIHRISAFNLDKNNVISRLLRLLLLSLGMFFFGLFKFRKSDTVFLVTNPALSIPFFSFLKKLKGFKYLILVHDVFPENLIPANIIKSEDNISYKVLRKIFNWSYNRASKLIVLGRDMEAVLEKKTKNTAIVVIENWADLDNISPESYKSNQLVARHQLANKVNFLFAGNLGRLQGLDFLFEVIAEVKNENVHFSFVGNGALLNQLKMISQEKNLSNVSYWGTFPRHEQHTFLNACHFGMVTLAQEIYGLGVPSKSYNILAAGKPIFFLGNKKSEIAVMIADEGCGIAFDFNDRTQIIEFFNQIDAFSTAKFEEMGAIGRKLAIDKYSKKAILEKFKNEILNDD